MDKPPLEKVLEKLKSLDIQRWNHTEQVFTICNVMGKSLLSIETEGLSFFILQGNGYALTIRNTESKLIYKDYIGDRNNKANKEMLKNFYETTLASLKEYRKKQLAEKLDSFISE